VADVLEHGGLLLAEAGTGTGKTLAYLLPAVESERRVVISTGTKNLQEQLVQKDLPILAQALGRELRVAVMKGRANYLCLLRFASFGKAGSFRRLEELPVYRAVEEWSTKTETGDRSEVTDMPDSVDFGASLGRERGHRPVVLALRRLLRDEDAPARSRPTWWW
jgi:ATP-dependent DNA helicase DinG